MGMSSLIFSFLTYRLVDAPWNMGKHKAPAFPIMPMACADTCSTVSNTEYACEDSKAPSFSITKMVHVGTCRTVRDT